MELFAFIFLHLQLLIKDTWLDTSDGVKDQSEEVMQYSSGKDVRRLVFCIP
jgi:hypothetical protein